MATTNTKGLFAELGLGKFNEQEAFQAGLPSLGDGTSTVATLQRGARELGRRGGGAIAGGINAFKERKDGDGFLTNFGQGIDNMRDDAIARGAGMSDRTELRKRRQTRREVQNINVPTTGDPLADQQATLSKIIEIATRNGDTEIAVRARQKKTALEVQSQEMEKAEQGLDQGAIKTKDDRLTYAQKYAEGIPYVPEGEDPTAKDFRPSHLMRTDVPGVYTGVDSQGNRTEGITEFVPYDVTVNGHLAGGRLRVSDKLVPEATAQMGGARGFRAAKTGLDDIVKLAQSTGSIADTWIEFANPESTTGFAGDFALWADKGLRFAESSAAAITGVPIGDGSYTDKVTGNKVPKGGYTYGGVRVSPATQKKIFLEHGTDSWTADVIASFPAHLRAQLAETALGSAKLKAQIMNLAYLDARQQEPSNRGLSDKDIEAALQRIGAFAANPRSFLQIQMEKQRVLLDELNFVGDGIIGTETHSKEDIVNAIWTPVQLGRAKKLLTDNISKLQDADSRILAQQKGATDATGPDRVSGLQPKVDADGNLTIPQTNKEFLDGF